MRSYIFTDRERRIVQRFLGDRTKMTDRDLSKIRSRLKLFDRLKNDVFLYLEFYDALLLSSAESAAAVST
ncbi:MAG: hypothetical protein JSW53_01805 [Candidatus Bathyarchaeota archaeon]|nr:MAG: hypothetical protein JSW53_01805 [Candidatus Bathyarchaeota archaeon]